MELLSIHQALIRLDLDLLTDLWSTPSQSCMTISWGVTQQLSLIVSIINLLFQPRLGRIRGHHPHQWGFGASGHLCAGLID